MKIIEIKKVKKKKIMKNYGEFFSDKMCLLGLKYLENKILPVLYWKYYDFT